MAGFDIGDPAFLNTLLLFAGRVGGVMMIAPIFSARAVPVRIRTAILLLLTVLLQPVAFSHAAEELAVTPLAFIAEVLIGFTVGLGAAVLVGAAEAAGDLMAVQIGLSGAASLDPLTQHSVPVLGQFMHLFAVTLLLALDAHFVMLDALAATVRVMPVGGQLDLQAGIGAMVSTGSVLFGLGLRLAAPVIAVVMIANVAVGILSRAAPTLNILAVVFPVQIGVGLFVLTISLPYIATFFTGWEGLYDAILTHVFEAFTSRGGD